MAISNRFTLILVVFCATNVLANFVFEGEEDDVPKRNAASKKPVFLPQRCNENELFYPGDQKNDWVCDCKPGYIYYPKSDRCFSPYRQGPCPVNQFLMIAPGQYIPECLPSHCTPDGYVAFKSKCYLLNAAGPCELSELTYVVAVNATTLALECIKQNPDIHSRFGDEDEKVDPEEIQFGTSCLPGTKRSIEGKCEK